MRDVNVTRHRRNRDHNEHSTVDILASTTGARYKLGSVVGDGGTNQSLTVATSDNSASANSGSAESDVPKPYTPLHSTIILCHDSLSALGKLLPGFSKKFTNRWTYLG